MDEALESIRLIREAVDASLEQAAIAKFGAAEECSDDGFGPPKDPIMVECWHCGDKYSSSEMLRMYRPRMQASIVEGLGNGFSTLDPLWWCKNRDCDGGGFGHDIHPLKEKKSRVSRKAVAA
jgi:hypothetical protein